MERLRRAPRAGPSGLWHVGGSQNKRIRQAQKIALRSTPRGGIYSPVAARGPHGAPTPGGRPCPRVWTMHGNIRRGASTSVRTGGAFQRSIRPIPPRAKMRSPVTLRDLMIHPVRTGYIGQEQPIAAAELPKSAAELYPDIGVGEVAVSFAGWPHPLPGLQATGSRRGGRRAGGAMMLYLQGGGFTGGQSEDTAYITSRIAAENAMVVVSANYRLALEWPFPACLDDSLAVLQWMRKNGPTLGGDGTRIAVGGDSAGGNLAAALVIKARDEGVSPPQAPGLLAPITDFFFEQHESFERLAPLGIVYDAAFIGFIRDAYLVHGENWAHPHASPARADLRNYPPTFIATGTADPLVDDNRAFAHKLRAAGGG